MEKFEPIPESKEESNVREEHLEIQRGVLSRRKFLKATGLGIAGMLGGVLLPSIYEGSRNMLEKKEIEKLIADLEMELSEKYGIFVRAWKRAKDDPGDRPTGIIRESLKERSPLRAYNSLLNLKEGLEHYPPNLIRSRVSGIEIVYSVKSAYANEVGTQEAVTSFGGNITIRAGHQSFMSYKAAFGEVLDKNVFHHEIAHVLTDRITKEDWIKLHPSAQYVGKEWVKLEKRPEGFAIKYGAKSWDEDIATIAELLFSNKREVDELTKGDDILNTKIEFVKNYYEKLANGKIKFN